MASVLLVDDVGVVRMTLRKFLERGGHSVTECIGGDQAAERLKSARFDIIVTDLWMPEGDGLDFIRKVKEAGGAKIPIVAVTGGAPRAPNQFSVEQAIQAGADKVLMKPVAKDELLNTVTELTESNK
jgi:CheY-like chemotaxis protein